MKKLLLLPLLLLSSGLFAQHNFPSTLGKTLPSFDPNLVQGVVKVCVKTAETEVPMEGVAFELEFLTPPPPDFWMDSLTGPDGCIKVFGLPTDCTIRPWKNINLLNGVTMDDVLLINNHLLGITPLESPYKIIATDINWSGSITTADMANLVGLLNGEIDTMRAPSWYFITADYAFPNPNNPFQTQFPPLEPIGTVQTLQFLGIKMGDVDGTANPNGIGTDDDPTAAKTLPPIDPTKIVQGISSDTEAPVVTCLNGLSVNVMPTGMIQLWASDFLLSVSDNVTPTDQIKIGIRKAGTGTGFPVDGNGNPIITLTFNCNELELKPIELWAIDAAGNADYCETSVLIQDGSGYCVQLGNDTVKVCITFGCSGTPMVGVPLNIDINPFFLPPVQNFSDSITGSDGCANLIGYDFNNSIIVTPEIDDYFNNGVTTYDLLLIAKHILGVQPLDNPYKLIAADANKSGSITTFDLVELRKNILGIYSELPNNTSWRFVDGDFVFPNPMNPFGTAFPEYIIIGNGQMTDREFVGMKIGDVDCSVTLDSIASPPDFPDALLAMSDTLLLAGQVYDIPLYMAENGSWAGYQFALNWDAQKLEFQTMSLHNETSLANWNTLLVQQGILSSSWFQYDVPRAFGVNAPIAIIRFKALQTVLLKEEVSLSHDFLHPEGYAGLGAEKRDLVLIFEQQFKPDPAAEKNLPPIDPTKIFQGISSDTEAPVITCLNGLSVNVMPTGMIQLWASDFLLSVSDNVTPTDQIKIGIRKAGTGIGFPVDGLGNPIQQLLFVCYELGTNGVDIWAKDQAGNTSKCQTYVIIQDNSGNCSGSPHWDGLIGICANTEMNDGLEDLEYIVTGTNPNGPFYANQVAGPNMGCGYFDVPLGSDVIAAPLKDDNPLNGVTTYDLVLISKHYRGIELLNSPYKIIAADANHDGLVTMEDSIELRKLILGIYTELPNNTSWRFVDKSYVFPDATNPFVEVFPESLTVQNIQFGVSADFIGVKVGDVNSTAASLAELEEKTEFLEKASIGLPAPNPTDGRAILPIYLPTAENLRLEISDLAGKLLWTNDLKLEQGNHNLEIPASALSGKGVFAWRVRAGEIVKTGKLVRL